MINRVVLTGRTTRKPELRNTKSGISVCEFTLAVDRNFKNKSGNRETDFISCVAWQKTAEVISQYVGKGSAIGVDGRIQTRSYENKDGQKVYVTEVVVENFSFLGGQDKGNQNKQDDQPFTSSGAEEADFSDLPF